MQQILQEIQAESLAQLQAYLAELIQIAAVAVAMAESLDRNELSVKIP